MLGASTAIRQLVMLAAPEWLPRLMQMSLNMRRQSRTAQSRAPVSVSAVPGASLTGFGQPDQGGRAVAPALVAGGRPQIGGGDQAVGKGGELAGQVGREVQGSAGPPGPCVSRSRAGLDRWLERASTVSGSGSLALGGRVLAERIPLSVQTEPVPE